MEKLAQAIAERVHAAQRGKPKLRLVDTPAPAKRLMCAVTRSSHIRVINHHRRWYGLQLLVDQACIGYAGIDDLPDEAILALHRDIDRARECIKDGISLEDAGLIRACHT